MSNAKQATALEQYKVGDSDRRPWGSYVVTAVGMNARGEEYCEKEITVSPGCVLSLQSHEHRRETWTVKSGVLTVIVDDRKIALEAGKSVDVPKGSIHCMANLDREPCVVHELQEGLCREEDIKRYVDAYGRGTEDGADDSRTKASLAHYQSILDAIAGRKS